MDIVERLGELRLGDKEYDVVVDAIVEIELLRNERDRLRDEVHFDDQTIKSLQVINERLQKNNERLRKEIDEYDDMIRDAGWYLTDDGGNSYKNADEIISHFLLAKDKAKAEQNAALKEGE